MGEGPKENGNRGTDLFEQWHAMRDTFLDIWAKALNDTVKSSAYAQSTGVLLDTMLTVSSPFREALQKTVLTALEQLHMPSREDFVSLAERLTNLETRLDDMDAKLDRLEKLLSRPARSSARKREEKGAE